LFYHTYINHRGIKKEEEKKVKRKDENFYEDRKIKVNSTIKYYALQHWMKKEIKKSKKPVSCCIVNHNKEGLWEIMIIVGGCRYSSIIRQ
jgi:diphthamide synthase subunit DPH2